MLQNTTHRGNQTHVPWLDAVRLVAMFLVICCHCTDPFNFCPADSPDIQQVKFWGAAYGSVLRPCVPLFVMLTGALLLPVTGNISVFRSGGYPAIPGGIAGLYREYPA